MRYKVRTPDLSAFRDVLAFLSGRKVPVFVASEKRRLLSIGDLPDADRREITAKGAEVTPELQYDLEAKI
jgi:hypothetical protein